MQLRRRLSAALIRTVKTLERYGDERGGNGLSLLVKPTASDGYSKTFSQRLRLAGRSFNIRLGPYPPMTLAEAR